MHLEHLETRLALAAGITWDARQGTLAIVGSAGSDVAEVHRQGTAFVATVTNDSGTVSRAVPAARVRAIAFSGLDGNDTFTNSTQVRSVADGGAGDDVLAGGGGNDRLVGGDGNDRLSGNAGADVLIGGAHADTLLGGAGNDQLFGNAGGDRVFGDAGDEEGDQMSGSGMAGTSLAFDPQGYAYITDTSANRRDAKVYTFTATLDGMVSVAIGENGGRAADLEVVNARSRTLLELEPQDNRVYAGNFNVMSGERYTVIVRSHDLGSVGIAVRLRQHTMSGGSMGMM
jgi:Ca2+-binding RTX toxin-like protein